MCETPTRKKEEKDPIIMFFTWMMNEKRLFYQFVNWVIIHALSILPMVMAWALLGFPDGATKIDSRLTGFLVRSVPTVFFFMLFYTFVAADIVWLIFFLPKLSKCISGKVVEKIQGYSLVHRD